MPDVEGSGFANSQALKVGVGLRRVVCKDGGVPAVSPAACVGERTRENRENDTDWHGSPLHSRAHFTPVPISQPRPSRGS